MSAKQSYISWRSAARTFVTAMSIAIATALAGCGTSPKAPRSGGFYQNDGPPEQAPADIMATPDALPTIEPFHPYANRPYIALGRRYTPITDDRPLVQRGLASWYGRQFHGNRTSTGEPYDMFAMSAAHPTMPLPSYARVTNLRNGRTVIVRVNDRGPFKEGRVVDLSYAAAVRLGIAAAGTGEVEVQRITHRRIAAGKAAAEVAETPRPAEQAQAPPFDPPARRPTWAVQLGAFEAAANAEALRERFSSLLATSQGEGLPAEARLARVERDGVLHRVLVGMLADRAAAAELAAQLTALLGRETALFLR